MTFTITLDRGDEEGYYGPGCTRFHVPESLYNTVWDILTGRLRLQDPPSEEADAPVPGEDGNASC